MSRGRGLVAVALGLACSFETSALAQPEAKPEVKDEWWGEGFPKAGQPLPNVEIYNDKGDAFKTSLLKGKYTVLIFGCLT